MSSFTADKLAKCEREKLEKPGAEPTMMATFSSTMLRSTVSLRDRNMQVIGCYIGLEITYLQRDRMVEIHVVSFVCVISILSAREAILAAMPLL